PAAPPASPAIPPKTQKSPMAGTQKLPRRIVAGAVEALANGGDASSAAYVVALWIAYVRKAAEINDPRATELKAAAAGMTADDPSAPFFAIAGLFPQALTENGAWRARVNAELEKL
ncbi:mannitol dehydrogenase family protein, partial [Neorhizobium galegae]|nr:mannitol dehydrogenase family protein [Neorhizobium galegae]